MILALRKELELRKGEFKNVIVETIYFGGGTPSVLTTREIRLIIDSVYANYVVIDEPEITLEANPDDLTSAKILELAKSPINRLSIGIQSFFDKDLKWMNRAHSANEAEDSLSVAMQHFENISIDLIYGIPGMSNERWRQNIERALVFKTPHISSYALTVEPKTALENFIKKGMVRPVEDELAQEQHAILVETLEANGFINYEISNFGKPGFFSRNNTAYWQQKKYIGIGPSAHSFDGIRRGWNISNNVKYIKALEEGKLPMETEVLSRTDHYNEYIMTGLRTIWGVSLLKIRNEFGQSFEDYLLKNSGRHIEAQLLQIKNDALLTTKKGKFLIDGIASDLFVVK